MSSRPNPAQARERQPMAGKGRECEGVPPQKFGFALPLDAFYNTKTLAFHPCQHGPLKIRSQIPLPGRPVPMSVLACHEHALAQGRTHIRGGRPWADRYFQDLLPGARAIPEECR